MWLTIVKSMLVFSSSCLSRPEGKKYEKALEWKIKVVNSAFLADIIHNGQLPAVLFHRYTTLNQPNEFSPESCFEASRILGFVENNFFFE